jgi:hypothetical protein
MIRGLQAAYAELRGLEKSAKQAQKRGELRAAEIIATEARAAAKGSLVNKIGVGQTEVSTTIIGGDDFSAYVEFGTGDNAKAYVSTLPKEAQAEALKFFVNGKGRSMPAPFFFPSIFRNRDKIFLYVDEELNKIGKK